MAVEATITKRRLTIALDDGTTASGNVREISRSFDVDKDATDQQLMNIANALSPLYSKTVYAVYVATTSSIWEE